MTGANAKDEADTACVVRIRINGEDVYSGEFAREPALEIEVAGDVADLRGNARICVLGMIGHNVETSGDVVCDTVGNDVHAGGNVTCNVVENNVVAKGNATCNVVAKDVSTSGGNATCNVVAKEVSTDGGNVTCNVVKKDGAG